jgi:AAA15 family ATPase/GTPase
MEHIKHIEIQNFKSIKHCIIDGCKRINVFVGPPNVGKSNILEAMGLMSNFQNLDEFKSTIRYNDIFSL